MCQCLYAVASPHSRPVQDGDTRLSLTEFMERMDRIVEAKAERTLAKKAKGSKKESGKRRKRRPGKE